MAWQGVLGLVVFGAVAFAMSHRRQDVPWLIVAKAFAVQVILALVFLKNPALADVLSGINQMVATLKAAADAGSHFVFGYVGGAPAPFEVLYPARGLVIAFQILPIIVVASDLAHSIL